MLQVDMNARKRNSFGKGAARTTRRAGQTPAIVYGPKTEPLALELNTKEFTKRLIFINRRNAVVNLSVDDNGATSTRSVMIKEIQADPIHDTLVHADFMEISLDAEMTVTVPLHFTGKAKGVDLGGDMTILATSVQLRGKPLDIPDVIEVNVAPLGLGDGIALKDLAVPAGVSLQSAPDRLCVSISGTVSEQPAAAEEK